MNQRILFKKPATCVPVLDEDGKIAWIEKRHLGDVEDLNNASGSINSVLSIVGAKPSGGVTQTDTGKAAQQVELVSSTVAKYGAAVPPPAGEIIVAVASIVTVAAKLIDSIFGSDKDKAKLAEANQIDAATAITRSQIIAVDQQINNVANALQQLQNALRVQGLAGLSNVVDNTLNQALQQKTQTLQTLINAFNATVQQLQNKLQVRGLAGLGSAADNTLYDAKVSANTLNETLQQKTQTLQTLINAFNATVQQTAKATQLKSDGGKYFLIGIGTLLTIGFGYALYVNLRQK